jgi:signal transduction histidine kinase
MRRWRSFPVQLFVLIVLPLMALLLFIALGSLSLHQRAMREMVGERDERAIRAAAATINEQLNHRRMAVRSLVLQVAATQDPAHALTDAAFLLPDFSGGLAIYDAQGTYLTSTPEAERWTGWVDSTQWLLSAGQASGGTLFASPQTDPISGESWLFAVAQEGTYLAVGAFSPANLAREALTNLFGDHHWATAFILSDGGTVLYQTGSHVLSTAEIQQHPGVAAAAGGNSGTTYRQVAGEEHVIAFSVIEPVGWILVVEEPWHLVADPLLRATEQAPLLVVPVLLLTVLVVWWGIRQIVQPLQRLESQATRLGQGDFAAIEKPVGGIPEIQHLQTQLVQMAHKVKAAQQNLRGYLGAVTTGQEEERRRLARDLHDETVQSLIALNQQIQLAQLAAADKTTSPSLDKMQQMVAQIVADLRRLTHDLRPSYLDELGLVPALNMLARDMSKTLAIPITFHLSGSERRLTATAELALYRIAQEGMRNVARHARATAATVTLAFAEEGVQLTVQDNGQGFVVPENLTTRAANGHFGLLGIQERAELIGAQMQLHSAPGEGTALSITLAEK